MRRIQQRIVAYVLPELAQAIVKRFGTNAPYIGDLGAQALLSMSVIDRKLHPNEINDSIQFLALLRDCKLLTMADFDKYRDLLRSRIDLKIDTDKILQWAQAIPVELWQYHRDNAQKITFGVTNHQHLVNQIVFTLSALSLVSYACLFVLVSDMQVDAAELKLMNEIIRIFEKPERLFAHITTIKNINTRTRNVLFSEFRRHVVAFIDESLIPLRLMRLVISTNTGDKKLSTNSSQRWSLLVNEITEISPKIITEIEYFNDLQISQVYTQQLELPAIRTIHHARQPDMFSPHDLTMDSIAGLTSVIEDEEERIERAVELQLLAEEVYGQISITDGESIESGEINRVINPLWERTVTLLRSKNNLTFEQIEQEIAYSIKDVSERIDAYQYIMERLLAQGTRIYEDNVVVTPTRALTLNEVEQLVADVSDRFTDSFFAEYSFDNQRISLYHDLLSASEERDLTRARAMVDAYASGTAMESERFRCEELVNNIRETLINHNYRLVMRIAVTLHFGHNVRHLDQMDLFQSGCLGLIKAIDKFDSSRGLKISTYATWWIRQAISRAIDDQERGIRLPVHFLELIRRYKREVYTYESIHGFAPTSAQMADVLGTSLKHIDMIMYWDRRISSLDQSVGDGDVTLGELVIDDDDVENEAQQQLLVEFIRQHIKKLTEREQLIINLRFGLNGDDFHTLEEVGKSIGLTRERVRQIEVKALSKLKPHMLQYKD